MCLASARCSREHKLLLRLLTNLRMLSTQPNLRCTVDNSLTGVLNHDRTHRCTPRAQAPRGGSAPAPPRWRRARRHQGCPAAGSGSRPAVGAGPPCSPRRPERACPPEETIVGWVFAEHVAACWVQLLRQYCVMRGHEGVTPLQMLECRAQVLAASFQPVNLSVYWQYHYGSQAESKLQKPAVPSMHM